MKRSAFLICVLFISVNSFAIRVLLVDKETRITITANGSFSIIDRDEPGNSPDKSYTFAKGGKFIIETRGSNCVRFDSIRILGNLILIPDSGTTFTTNKTEKNSYAGVLKVCPANAGFRLIEDIETDKYLYGVLPFEMSASWPVEALKVQAVAARTYAVRNLMEPEDADFDVYSGVMSQMYKGVGNILNPQNRKIYKNVIDAVDGTKGEVLTYKGKIFTTYYHSNCGGHTGPPVWNKPEDEIEPLQGAECNACTRAGDFKNKIWTSTFTNAQIQAFTSTLYTDTSKVEPKNYSGNVVQIIPAQKTTDGRAITLTFVSEKGDTAMATCQNFRLAIGASNLKSCNLDVIKKEADGSFTFSGRGFGHGAGMCQMGAKRLAEDGKTYKEILSVYYPSAKIMDYKKVSDTYINTK